MVLCFDSFELDVDAFELRRDGEPIAIEPRVLDFLVCLAKRPGRLFTKDQIMEAIWPDHVVAESSLSRCVSDARRALNDNPRSPRFIQTVHRRGFRFVAEVTLIDCKPRLIAGDPADVFVGRDVELMALKHALDRAANGTPQTVLLFGEPGIGKSRLIDRFASLTDQSTALCRVGRCREGEGAPSFWPWVQILRQEKEMLGDQDFTAACGGPGSPHASAIASLIDSVSLPSVCGKQRDLGKSFDLFDAVAAYFGRVSMEVPRVLFIDDLHRADAATVRLASFVRDQARSSRLLTVAASREAELRDNPELAGLVADLVREQGVKCVSLDGFSTHEVRAFVAVSLGRQVPEDLADSLHDRTGGNPFFLSQLVQFLDEDLKLQSLPAGIQGAIRRQLACLSPSGRSILEAASVIGRNFSLGVLELAIGGEGSPCAGIDEAVEARIVRRVGARSDQYQFAHVLVREALYDGLPPEARESLHRRVGTALELHADAAPGHLFPELAFHFLNVRNQRGRDRALSYLVRAAEWDTQQAAYERAVEHYAWALEVLDAGTSRDPVARCQMLIALGSAHIKAGDRVHAKQVLRDAADLARHLDAVEALASAALSLAPGFFALEIGVVDYELVGLLREALSRLGRRDDALRARLLARLATALYWVEPPSVRRDLSHESAELARASGDRASLADALSAKCAAFWNCDHATSRVELSRKVVEIAESQRDIERSLVFRFLGISALLEIGNMAAVDREAESFSRLALQLRQPQSLWYVHLLCAMRAYLRGDLAECERSAQRVLEIGGRLQDKNALQSYGALSLALNWERSGDDRLLAAIHALVVENPRVAGWRCALLKQFCELDRRVEAEAEFERVVELGIADRARDVTWIWDASMLADGAAYLGRDAAAKELYRILLPYEDRLVVIGFAVLVFGTVGRVLANAADCFGEREAAARHFERAIARCKQIDSPVWLAHTQFEYARALVNWGRKGRCAPLVAEALQVSRRLGLRTLEQRLVALV